MADSIPYRPSASGATPPAPTRQRQPPTRVCERMIKLVADILTGCRSALLRDELVTLQHSLLPAARELDKWVSTYKTYGTKPGQDLQGLIKLHNEILTGDQEIASYLIKSAKEYVDWCADELGACIKQPLTTDRMLQEGFLKEDLRNLGKTYDQLRDMLASNLKHKRWMNPNQAPKRKHEAAPVTDANLRAGSRSTQSPLVGRDVEVIELLDSSDDSLYPAQSSSGSRPSTDLGFSLKQFDQDMRPRKRAKRDRVLPVDPELASHAASSILRAIGRHPDLPPLNSRLDDVLPHKLRRQEIPAGGSLATVQDTLVKMAEQWWAEEEKD